MELTEGGEWHEVPEPVQLEASRFFALDFYPFLTILASMSKALMNNIILQQGTRETDPELAVGEATNGVNAGVTDGKYLKNCP